MGGGGLIRQCTLFRVGGRGKGKRIGKKRYLPLLLNKVCDKLQGMYC